MTTMRAVVVFTSGGPEVVRVEEIDRPTPGSGEVLLEVHAAGVNPADLRGRSGFADLPPQYRPPIARPSVPGADVSGQVVAVGADVAELSVGDQVYGLVRFPPFDGRGPGRTHAEYVNVPVADLAPKPHRLSHIEAAAVPMAALTAWQQIHRHGAVAPGERVLVVGAAGGVGHFAVQLARLHGAEVVAVASGRHEKFLRELGIETFVDYTAGDPIGAVGTVDVVIDCVGSVGGVDSARWLSVIVDGGRLVPITLGFYPPEELSRRGIARVGGQVQSSGADLRELNKLFDAGTLTVAIDSVYPLEDARSAHERAERGHAQGKIVLAMPASTR
ncbi:NADP-dependent oxidoreductase [Nocardia brevicatena]|uniref:NADP-dependent oxidoreductase n=1 Tax=Nocardia brevicatena TaxID=37327 RepID=UPI00030F1894|nr:NADP-dependent oxidoreductase [Nocardia brevicatena]